MIDKLSNRELDVFACAANGRGSKKTAMLLSIKAGTIDWHIKNIMLKLNIYNRESIIDFAEKNCDLDKIKEHYLHIVANHLFLDCLTFLAKSNKNAITNISIIKQPDINELFITKLSNDLKKINITVSITDDPNIQHNQTHYYLYLYSKYSDVNLSHQSIPNVLIGIIDDSCNKESIIEKNYNHIHFSKKDYFISFLYLIKLITPNIDITKFETMLLKIGSNDLNHIDDSDNLDNDPTPIKAEHKTIYIYIILPFFIIALVFATYQIFNNPSLKQGFDTTSSGINEARTKTWNLPKMLDCNVERKELIKTIQQALQKNAKSPSKPTYVGLYGLAGSGKTSLANYIIRNPLQKYSFRAWFKAEQIGLLKNDYLNLGLDYGLFNDQMTEKQKISAVKKWLEQQENTLLVYDNVSDIDKIDDFLPDNGHIILTSKNHKLPGAILVDIMTPEESTQLVNTILSSNNTQETEYRNNVKSLIEELQYLPLALSQAASYISENNLSIPDYLFLYTHEKERLLSDNTMPVMDRHEPTYITWKMSIKAIEQNSQGEDAVKLFEAISCSHPEQIPTRLLIHYVYGGYNTETQIKFNSLLNLIKQHSLIQISSNSISVHRLVHSFLYNEYFIKNPFHLVKKYISSAEEMFSRDNQVLNNIDLIKSLLSHLENLLSKTEYLPLIQDIKYNNLIEYIGQAYFKLGHYEKSKKLLKNILAIQEQNLGAKDIKISKTLDTLGAIHLSISNYKKSLNLLQRALDIQEQHFGIGHIETATTLSRLGTVNESLNLNEKAKNLLERALDIQEQHFGIGHIETAITLSRLGSIHTTLALNEKARNLLERALDIQQTYCSTGRSIETAITLSRLGRLYLNLGLNEKARMLLEQALTIQEKYFGSGHLKTAITLSRLGLAYSNLGLNEKARILLEQALTIQEKYFGKWHKTNRKTLSRLAEVNKKLGLNEKAKSLLEQALAIQEKKYLDKKPKANPT